MSLDFKTPDTPEWRALPDEICETLIWRCWHVGISGITEHNAPEFYARCTIHHAFRGGVEITPDHVRSGVGLFTNVITTAPTKWRREVMETVTAGALRAYRRAEEQR